MEGVKLRWKCPACGEWNEVDFKDIESLIYSDPHDPDRDMMKCQYFDCQKLADLCAGQEVILVQGKVQVKALLWSDEVFLLLKGKKGNYPCSSLNTESLVYLLIQMDYETEVVDSVAVALQFDCTIEEVIEQKMHHIFESQFKYYDTVREGFRVVQALSGVVADEDVVRSNIELLEEKVNLIGEDLKKYLGGIGIDIQEFRADSKE